MASYLTYTAINFSQTPLCSFLLFFEMEASQLKAQSENSVTIMLIRLSTPQDKMMGPRRVL